MNRDFLKKSPLARNVGADANVVVYRKELTSGDAKRIGREGMSLPLSEERFCEREEGGLVLAVGRIVKKKEMEEDGDIVVARQDELFPG